MNDSLPWVRRGFFAYVHLPEQRPAIVAHPSIATYVTGFLSKLSVSVACPVWFLLLQVDIWLYA